MRYLTILLITVLFLIACGQDKSKQSRSTYQEIPKQDTQTRAVDTDTSGIHPDSSKMSATEEAVIHIRKQFQRVNALPLVATRQSFVCDTDGTITYYTYKGKVVKIGIDWGFVGDGSTTSEYYYQDGKLIFEYQVSIGGPAGLPETRIEDRIYVHNDRTIRFIRNQQVIACRKCEFGPSSREYRALKAYEKGNIGTALCN